ncbi:MAG: ABC transporter permease [Candidatus Rokuibacteriota bacterium]|nr:MAG: ABC transporter permease [Candidatus Rokubacteria bacterium]
MIEGRATLGRRLLWTYCVLTLIFLCAPIVIVVIVSFNATEFIQFPPQTWSLRWYRNYFGARQWVEPTLLSLRIAAVTMVLATVLGTAAAIGLTRGRFRGRRALEFFFVSPMVVPSIVLAIGLYLLFARFKLVGQPLALYLAHTVVAAPLVIVIVSAALKTTDPAIELAARSLGAGYFRTLWHVTLPAILPAVVSGAAFAFLVSFDEVVLAIFLGGPNTTTLPKRMWESVRFEIDPTLTAISTLLVLIPIAILTVVEVVRRSSAAVPAPAPGRDSLSPAEGERAG